MIFKGIFCVGRNIVDLHTGEIIRSWNALYQHIKRKFRETIEKKTESEKVKNDLTSSQEK